MKVLVYAPLAILGHHQETDLEIAQNHIDAGDEVFFVSCGEDLKALDFYACRGVLRCSHCQSRCTEGLKQLTSAVHQLKIGPITPVECIHQTDLTSASSIKNFEYKGVDIGSAYLSSLISDLRDPNPNLAARVSKTKISLEFLAGLTDRFENLLNQVQPDKVYIFNGRFSLYRPLLRLCQKRNILFAIHERGPTNRMYSLTEGHMPHDIQTKNREMAEAWSNPQIPQAEKHRVGSDWLERRAQGIMANWRSFTSQQEAELLPKSWNDNNQNIAFFASSDDEFVAVPGWEPELFPTQKLALEFLCEKFKNFPEYQFYVRLHPNLRGLKNSSVTGLLSLEKQYSSLHVIGPESPISTYALIKKAKKVLTFGSTVGIESVYWGTPSILLGKSFYANLGAVTIPRDKDQLIDLIKDKTLAVGPREAAVQYAYWAATAGKPFKHYSPISLTTGRFNGHIITGDRLVMAVSYLSVLCHDLLKIFKGEYSFWHLAEKVRNKLTLARQIPGSKL